MSDIVRYDQADGEILSAAQERFPLSHEPYAVLGAELGLVADEVYARTCRLRNVGAIRRIGAVIGTHAIGLERTLVALRVAPEAIDQAAAVVNAQPGVTHNYLRDAEYNMWFTVSARTAAELDHQIAQASAAPGVLAAMELPSVRTFKIAVLFDLGHGRPARRPRRRRPSHALSQSQRRVLDRVQHDVPVGTQPYVALACEIGVSEDDLLGELAALLETGWIRRFAALLNHRKLGFVANAMTVWRVPAEHTEETGRRMAEFPEVTHCYERRPAHGWPYSIYAMVHDRTRAGCARTVQRISAAVGIDDYRSVFSTRELKKCSLTLPWADV